MKISQLLKYIADLNPQNTPVRLALYNFLRHFLFATDELNAQVLNSFFSHALEYPHWESNKSSFGKEVQALLEGFARFHKVDFDLSGIHFPQNIQLIEIQSFKDLIDVTARYAHSMAMPDDKFRLIPDQGRRVILILLRADKEIEVSVIDKKFVIRNGLLEPLRKDLKVTYDARLELKTNAVHTLEISPYLLAQFQMKEGKPQGSLLRGYVFQKYMEVQNLPLEEQTKIFYPLKRLEQTFIDRQSDPYYLELIGQLSEATVRWREGDLAAEKLLRSVLDRGDMALREIFIGDKTLAGLLSEGRQSLKPSVPKDPALWAKQPPQDLTR